jgi:hypothetical protein
MPRRPPNLGSVSGNEGALTGERETNQMLARDFHE